MGTSSFKTRIMLYQHRKKMMSSRLSLSSTNSIIVYIVIIIMIVLIIIITAKSCNSNNIRNKNNGVQQQQQQQQLPDTIVLPIPLSGNNDNPYFLNFTKSDANYDKDDDDDDAEYDKYHRGWYLVKTNYHWSAVLPNVNINNNTDDDDDNNNRRNHNYHRSPSYFLQTVLKQARINNCDIVATNGGPYDQGGIYNSGPTMINGKLIRTKSNPDQSKYIGFGIAYEHEHEHEHEHEQGRQHTSFRESQSHNVVDILKGKSLLLSLSSTSTTTTDNGNDRRKRKRHNKYWVMGTYGQLVTSLSSSSSSLSLYNKTNSNNYLSTNKKTLWDFVTGFDWLIYNGKSLVNKNNNNSNPTGIDRAPRTVIGLDKDSNLILLVVDGCEHCFHHKGLTVEELANLLLDHGVVFAINMDGGGSSTMVMPKNGSIKSPILNNNNDNSQINYMVVNQPTCLDIPLPYHCQRPVATVLCVSS